MDAEEIQALALARSLGCGVLMDELLERKVAQRYQIQAVGILGVFMQGKRLGLIAEMKPLIEQLQGETYRLSEALVASVLERMGEHYSLIFKKTRSSSMKKEEVNNV